MYHEHALREDVRMPMRDGVELSANVHLPDDRGTFPTLLLRTPYSNGADKFDQYRLSEYLKRGYAVVFQSTRGQGRSAGSFEFFFSDAKDGFDSVEWIATQSWSNGRVGMDGASYSGTVQWLAARERPPHLVCIAPTAPAGRFFLEIPYVGGAFHIGWAIDWIAETVEGIDTDTIDFERTYRHRPLSTADEVAHRAMPLYREMLRHSTLDGHWKRIEFAPEDFERTALPVFTVTGWFDGDQPGALSYWQGLEARSSGTEDGFLVIGPWTHEQTYLGGDTKLGELELAEASVIDIQAERLRFFDHYLKDSADRDRDRVRVFLTGTDAWQGFDHYPPREAAPRPLYFHSEGRARSGEGRLDWTLPLDEPADPYLYDPNNPVPYPPFAVDGGEIEARDDVLVYSSRVLEEPVTALGPVWVVLHAATDGRDTDFVATLLDVFPDGRSVNLAHGVLRARYRKGFDKPQLVTPNQAAEYRIRLRDVGTRFAPGHRIRLQVTSSSFPYVDPNTNTGNHFATDTECRVAQQTVFHDRLRPSHVLLTLLP